MSTDFNKNLFFDNISYLIKTQGLKVGEIESSAGVSTGYISRTSKDEKSKPSIDFVVKMAKLLNTNVDTLLRADLANITPTEKYLIDFLNKLISDTNADKLNWYSETKTALENVDVDTNNNINHPLFRWVTREKEGKTTEFPAFVSQHSGEPAEINNTCYNLRLKNGVYLYIMNVSDFLDDCIIEIWMAKSGGCSEFICDNYDKNVIAHLVNNLYNAIKENSSHPKINKELRYVIDAYMKNDLEDDAVPETLPF